MSPTLIELRAHVTRVRQANESLTNTTSRLLHYERQTYTSYGDLHAALRDLVGSIQEARQAQAALCLLLAVDPSDLDKPLDDVVPPLLEHRDV